MLPRHARWIDVVVARVRPPLAASGALRSLDGKKAEAPSKPRIIPGVGSERLPQFSSMVQTMRCRTAHLALLIFGKFGRKSPFLATDLEACPAPSLVAASGGDHG
jgi:hypothetical protein